ncbi:MAG TPA: M23 family metallopeptidase [Candidatus Binatia bacterium]
MDGLKPRAAWLLAFLLSPLFFVSCSVQSTPSRTAQGIHHVVQRGETLYRIGRAYDISYQELARTNRIQDPNQLRAGDKVFIPGATRQLPVEIITPSTVSLKRPSPADLLEKSKEGLIWPVAGSVSSGFGARGESFHDGIDILAPEGSAVRAVESGEVIYSDQLRGYGNMIIIRHPGGIVSVYAHNRKNRVSEGQTVAQGETIAEVGNSGRASAPHLHFEIRKANAAEDPLAYLPH